MIRELPPELFKPEKVWFLASAPLGEGLSIIIRQVVRTGTDVESIYVPAFTSLENARQGIGWLSPTEPEELVPFSIGELVRFRELLSALAVLGHAYLVLNPDSEHRGERISIREAAKAVQRHLTAAKTSG